MQRLLTFCNTLNVRTALAALLVASAMPTISTAKLNVQASSNP